MNVTELQVVVRGMRERDRENKRIYIYIVIDLPATNWHA